jgi:hypothetical protein
MDNSTLVFYLTQFVASNQAKKLCRPYGADPCEALGALYLGLLPYRQESIRNPIRWLQIYGTGLLRNYLRQEYLPLRQIEGR